VTVIERRGGSPFLPSIRWATKTRVRALFHVKECLAEQEVIPAPYSFGRRAYRGGPSLSARPSRPWFHDAGDCGLPDFLSSRFPRQTEGRPPPLAVYLTRICRRRCSASWRNSSLVTETIYRQRHIMGAGTSRSHGRKRRDHPFLLALLLMRLLLLVLRD